ncbi:hypothetical protein NMY22_g9267 [Coprinellus aureogranulatus]|nr:hypothetical protein NMY22_g9267 [Coprinellus aureogranulatus]
MPTVSHNHRPVQGLTWQHIPPELLGRIFEDALFSLDTSPRTKDVFGALRSELRLVCHQWNEMIVASPKFWNHVFVNYNLANDDASAEDLLAFVRLCVERSGNLERNLRVVNRADDPEEYSQFEKIIDYIHSQSNWAAVHIDWLYYTTFISHILHEKHGRRGYDYDKGYFPAIHTLALHRHKSIIDEIECLDEELEFDYGSCIRSEVFPSLRKLDIDLDLHTMQSWNLPYEQITDLRLVASWAEPWEEYVRTLRYFDALENLEFIVKDDNTSVSPRYYANPDEPVELDSLHSFTLDLRVKTEIGPRFIQKLRFPNLQTLKVSAPPPPGEYPRIDPHGIAPSLSHLLDGIESQVISEFDDPRLSGWIASVEQPQ